MNTKYINRFLNSKCSSIILDNKIFKNCKEITESFGAWDAIMKFVPFDIKDESVNVFVIGDGKRPQTGSIICLMSKWNVHSIDPIMELKEYSINRLNLFKDKIENLRFSCEKAVIVLVHSHASVLHSWNNIDCNEKYLINIPCCFLIDTELELISKFKDPAILSEKNEVFVYK